MTDVRILKRRGTAAEWALADPILLVSEEGYEEDTGKFKIGDGVSRWSELDYFVNEYGVLGLIEDVINTSGLDPRIGDLSELNTNEKDTIVGSINEVNHVPVPLTLRYANAKAG